MTAKKMPVSYAQAWVSFIAIYLYMWLIGCLVTGFFILEDYTLEIVLIGAIAFALPIFATFRNAAFTPYAWHIKHIIAIIMALILTLTIGLQFIEGAFYKISIFTALILSMQWLYYRAINEVAEKIDKTWAEIARIRQRIEAFERADMQEHRKRIKKSKSV